MKKPFALFKGKDTKSEEIKEAKAIKSGKITPKQYAAGEKHKDAMKKPRFAGGGLVGRGQGEARTKRTKHC